LGSPVEAPYPIDVRRQIWESLVTMLRVYAHAASLSGKEYVVTTVFDQAWVKHENCSLRICLHPESGNASWRVTQPELETRGEFRIDEDGALIFPDGAKPLDTAAIDWMEQLVRATRME
jgi:hypothetical protein